jgi:hypothetical protein
MSLNFKGRAIVTVSCVKICKSPKHFDFGFVDGGTLIQAKQTNPKSKI